MIKWLKGTVIESAGEEIILDVNGVGYGIATTKSDYRIGQTTAFYIYHHIREDIQALYGFATQEELACFKLLLSVSGVGPKAALLILKHLSPQQIYLAVEENKPAIFQSLPGVGAKVAAKIVVELKNKISNVPIDISRFGVSDELNEVLIQLGYKRHEVARVLSKIPKDIEDIQSQIKWALKQLAK